MKESILDMPARLVIRLLFGFASDDKLNNLQIVRRQCCSINRSDEWCIYHGIYIFPVGIKYRRDHHHLHYRMPSPPPIVSSGRDLFDDVRIKRVPMFRRWPFWLIMVKYKTKQLIVTLPNFCFTMCKSCKAMFRRWPFCSRIKYKTDEHNLSRPPTSVSVYRHYNRLIMLVHFG